MGGGGGGGDDVGEGNEMGGCDGIVRLWRGCVRVRSTKKGCVV
jgi:hypothetical protein